MLARVVSSCDDPGFVGGGVDGDERERDPTAEVSFLNIVASWSCECRVRV